jgi:two-component system phosphate regulon sensor histidine kinase PhoR
MRISIQYKLAFIFILLFFAILIGIYTYLDKNLTENSSRRIEENIIKETILVGEIYRNKKINRSNIAELDSIADKLADGLGVRVTVINNEGIVLGDSDISMDRLSNMENHLYRPEIRQALSGKTGISRRFSTTIRRNMLYAAVPISNGRIEGVVRVSLPLSEIEYISNKLKGFLAGAVIVAAVIIFTSIFAISLFVSRPLKKMSEAAKNIADGEFNEKIFYKQNDEVGDLARTFNEMTDEIRKRMDEVVFNKTRLETVLLSMFDGVMVVDDRGKILLMNETLKKEFLVKSDPVGRRPLEVVRNIEVQEMIDNILKGRKRVGMKELSILLSEEKIFHVHATQIKHAEKTEGAVLLFHDITGLRNLENIRKDFVANVSHELRTPVSSIKGYSETLIDGALEDKEHAEDFIKVIYSNANRLENLISDLLDLSRLESGKLNLDIRKTPVKEFIEKIVIEMRKLALSKNINIKTDIPESIAPMSADESKLAQCLTNILDNALKYTQEDGEVFISAFEREDSIDISVTDNGPGIPEKHLGRIFERFYRVDKARSRDLGGTGLGLSIVKHIVSEHKGTVSVKSTVGKGSTFIFSIPSYK